MEEAAYQRMAKRQASAEEPVTARIRRREQAPDAEWQRKVSEGEEHKAGVMPRTAPRVSRYSRIVA